MHEEKKKYRRWLDEKPVGDLTFGRLYVSADQEDLSPQVFLLLFEKEAIWSADGRVEGFKPHYAGNMKHNAVAVAGLDREQLHELIDLAFDRQETLQREYAAKRRVPSHPAYAPYVNLNREETDDTDDPDVKLRNALKALLGD